MKENALQAEALALVDEQPEPPQWQRLGETVEFNSLLLRLLELHGWTVEILTAIGGVIVIAHRDGVVVQKHGASVAEVATDVFQTAAALRERPVGL